MAGVEGREKETILRVECVCLLAAQSFPTLMGPHGLQPARLLCPWDLRAGILQWAALLSSRGSS